MAASLDSLRDRAGERLGPIRDASAAKATGLMWTALRAATKNDRLMSALDRFTKPGNPFAPERFADPYAFYERARELGPITYQRATRVWWITGAEEVEAALRLPEGSADRAAVARSMPPFNQLDPANLDLVMSMMLMRDAPDHTRLRSLVNRVFTPKAMSRLEPSIREICDDLLRELAGQTSFDAAEEYCDKVPIYAIGSLLGLGSEDWPRLKDLSDRIIRLVDPMLGFDPVQMDADINELRSVFEREFEQRRTAPQDDLMTALVEVSAEGDRLSSEELVSMCILLLIAGHETTSSLIGNAIVVFDQHRDQRRRLLDEPDLAANAVEEILRFEPPVHNTDRIVTADCEFMGHQLKKGQILGTVLAAANRDPRRHDRPNDFDIARPDPRPISFGHGAHHCLGAALARLEGRIAIPAWLDAFPEYAIADDGLEWKRSVTIRGPKRLQVDTGA